MELEAATSQPAPMLPSYSESTGGHFSQKSFALFPLARLTYI